jgi:hypothetical protein
MEITSQTIAPGARIVARDTEWLVRRLDRIYNRQASLDTGYSCTYGGGVWEYSSYLDGVLEKAFIVYIS